MHVNFGMLFHIEMEEVRLAQSRIEAEIPLLRSRLATSKAEMHDLSISESLYHELKQQHEESLSLREYILVNTFEIVNPLKRDLEVARKELETMREALVSAQDSHERELRQTSSRILSAESKAMDNNHTASQVSNSISLGIL